MADKKEVKAATSTENATTQQSKTVQHFPFRRSLFQNKPIHKENISKYGNKGVIRGLQWRKGWPVHRIGKFAGTFFPSGHKNHTLHNKVLRRQKARTFRTWKKHPRPGRKFVVSVIRQTVGWAPYERRIMELLRLDYERKALKFAKKRLGTHKRGKVKVAKLKVVVEEQRRQQQQQQQRETVTQKPEKKAPVKKAPPKKVEKKPVADKKPADDKKPKDDKKPADDKKPKDDKKPADDKKPKDDKKPADDKKPKDDKKPADDKKPKDDKKPADDKKPKEDKKAAKK